MCKRCTQQYWSKAVRVNSRNSKMVQIKEEDSVREFQSTRRVQIACKNCKSCLTMLSFVMKHSRTMWKMSIQDMDWDFKLIKSNNDVSHECGQKLGVEVDNETLLITKRSVTLIHWETKKKVACPIRNTKDTVWSQRSLTPVHK